MTEQTQSAEQQLQTLMNHEREIIKKMNVALRAGANSVILGQFDHMLTECRLAQQEIRIKQKSDGQDGDFDNYLSIG